jgi:hypothetical protein
MTFRTHLEHRDDCIVLRAEGDWDPASGRRALNALIDLCQREGVAKALIDTRALDGVVSILDRSEIGRIMAAARKQSIAFAIVCRPERVTPERFLELVSRNRGGIVKVVTDFGEGLLWLQGLATAQ